ncbi:angiopoietin-1 receptor-like isoform X2 [Asterias amurensis]|uniref:angiopoietin-1 receptor-like isoform X2 n=1 Tax=Asterias amurensis TaxID=7602 RepID=UPI003AB5569E
MVTPTPYGAGLVPVSLSCFRSSPDTDVDLSFGRPFMIGLPASSIQTDTTLPSGSSSSMSTTPSAVTQYLPNSVDSTGLFYCEGSNSGMTTRVYSIIHSYTRRFEPVDGLVTKTFNKGEDVTLSVSSVNGLGTGPIWRRIRNGYVNDLNSVSGQNTLTITLSSVDVMHGDLFAVIQSGVSVIDNHFGMIRIIVGGCSAGQWGPPACTGRCNQCYNGGVCDDETGQCICAPGFSGTNCLTACGMHRFGWFCEFQCGPGNLIISCTGSQFGLPDPYGSSCISGYSGRDCDTACSYGWFGAGCTETCRCQSGTCDIYTGVCSSGCALGWSGANCQENLLNLILKCPPNAYKYTKVDSGQVSVSWESPVASGGNVTSNPYYPFPSGMFGLGTHSITYIATDGLNIAVCNLRIFVILDIQMPAIFNCPGHVSTILPQGTTTTTATWSEPIVSDNQEGVQTYRSQLSGISQFEAGVTSVTYAATDQAGNQATCMFTVTVSLPCDNNECQNGATCQPQGTLYTCLCSTVYTGINCDALETINPIISCPPDVMRYISSRTEEVSVTWPLPTASDSSSIVSLTSNPVYPSGSGMFGSGTHYISYTATDGAGNQASCSFTITVTSDDKAPSVTGCPDPIKVNLPQGNSDVAVPWTVPSTSETIGVSQTETHQPGSRFTDGVTTVQYTFTDQAGNSAFCTFNVIVSALPVLNQPPMVTVKPTSATVTWQAWNVIMDTGDGPIIAYVVYFTPMEDSKWVSAGNITDTTQATYSFLVENLEPGTEYSFSVAAVRDGLGGEGPRSPSTRIQTLIPTTRAATTQRITASMATTVLPSGGSSTIIIVIICVIVIAVILVIGCLAYFLRVRMMRRQHSKPQESTQDQEMASYENEITPDVNIDASATDYEPVGQNQTSANEPVGDIHSSPTYEDVGLPTWAKPWSVPWGNFMEGTKVLGKGQFGEVRYGGVMIQGEFCKAAIKKLRESSSHADRQNFLDEFKSMTKIRRHPNIVKIIGACQHEGELYVAMEYLPNGDLRSYLRNARSMDGEESLSSDKLLQFALDVAKGMQHLATSGVIHRDLAARNILLDENLVAKISDFGLSRGEGIYVQASKTRVPTRWLSLESLTNKTYTTKSDVWSYGILLWEIATVGGTPYPGIQTGVLRSKLKTGYRMPKPTNCDIKIYDLMLKCWQEKPDERPSFKKIVSVLTTMTENQDDEIYMSLHPRSEEHKYVNISPEFDDN